MKQYHVVVNKQRLGPIDEAGLVQKFRSGEYPQGTYVWCEGMEKWKPMTEVPDLVAAIAAPDAPPSPESAHKGGNGRLLCIIAGVLVIGGVLAYYMAQSEDKQETSDSAPSSSAERTFTFKSPADFQEYLEYRASQVKKQDPDYAKRLQESIPEYMQAFEGGSHSEQQVQLAAFMAACGEADAVGYLFKEKGFSAGAANYAYEVAATFGRVEVMKRLETYVEEYTDKDGKADTIETGSYPVFRVRAQITNSGSYYHNVHGKALYAAARRGHVDVCRYLVQERSVSVERRIFDSLLSLSHEDYVDEARYQGYMDGKKVSAGKVEQGVADAAAFLLEAQGGYMYWDPDKVQACPNAALKEVLQKNR